jgi:hypothetical protein
LDGRGSELEEQRQSKRRGIGEPFVPSALTELTYSVAAKADRLIPLVCKSQGLAITIDLLRQVDGPG